MTPNRIGQQLGNYRLVSLLGKGGFAEVYLGEHVFLQTRAAIKVLHTQLAETERDSFLTEARTIANLNHPHIVRVLDFDLEEGTPFLVMSYAPNGTLRQRHPRGKPLPTIVSYVKQVADALQYAHNERLIHRDVKPENMLVGPHDEVLLSDFGIALLAQSSHSQSIQGVSGTALYMAPEQILGKPRPASDQYALGIVVYEWLCGQCPFRGSTPEIYGQHLHALPPPLRAQALAILPELEEVLMTALAKQPQQRFASVQAFATALEQASRARQGQVSASVLQVPQPSSPSPQVPSRQPLPVVSPSLPSSQEVPITLPARVEITGPIRPDLHPPSPESSNTPPSSLTLQPGTPSASKHLPHRRRFSWLKATFLIVLAFLIIGSTGFLYTSVSTYTAHVQATATIKASPTATALAATKAYDAFVAAHGMMFGFDTARTHFNPYELVLNSSNISKLTQLWTYPAIGSISTSPAVVNGIIYFGSLDKSLYALDAQSRSILWSYQTGDGIYSSPTVVNGVVYVGSDSGKLYAFHLGG